MPTLVLPDKTRERTIWRIPDKEALGKWAEEKGIGRVRCGVSAATGDHQQSRWSRAPMSGTMSMHGELSFLALLIL